MPPRVTVLLPAYNAAATLDRAVASVAAQTHANWELLIVDDGSTDGTRELAESAAARDPRIRVVTLPRGGIVAALNAGLAVARGEYIARMDADDRSHADRLGEQVAWLDRAPDVGLVSCLVEFGGDRVANAGYALHVDWINSVVTPEAIRLNRFVESPFAHPSVMFRRDLVDRHGGYRGGDWPEDYELWLRWLDAGVLMAKVPRTLLCWVDSPARLSRTDVRYDAEKFFAVKAKWIARTLERIGGGRPVLVWGAGRPTRKRAALLEPHRVRIAGWIDIDPKKTGRTVAGVPVIPPEALPPPDEAVILGYVASRGARDLIRSALTARNYTEGRDFLMCA